MLEEDFAQASRDYFLRQLSKLSEFSLEMLEVVFRSLTVLEQGGSISDLESVLVEGWKNTVERVVDSKPLDRAGLLRLLTYEIRRRETFLVSGCDTLYPVEYRDTPLGKVSTSYTTPVEEVILAELERAKEKLDSKFERGYWVFIDKSGAVDWVEAFDRDALSPNKVTFTVTQGIQDELVRRSRCAERVFHVHNHPDQFAYNDGSFKYVVPVPSEQDIETAKTWTTLMHNKAQLFYNVPHFFIVQPTHKMFGGFAVEYSGWSKVGVGTIWQRGPLPGSNTSANEGKLSQMEVESDCNLFTPKEAWDAIAKLERDERLLVQQLGETLRNLPPLPWWSGPAETVRRVTAPVVTAVRVMSRVASSIFR